MKENFQAMCDDILEKIGTERAMPRLLLHACCAPCSSYTLEYLSRYLDITIYYYNPNIHPAEEYERRLDELEKFLPKFCASPKNAAAGIKVVLQKADYKPQEFFDAVQAERDNLQAEPERGERCRRCYQLRMEKAYEYARQNGFDWFTTTLSISPHKDAQMINEIGRSLEQKAEQAQKAAPKFLYSDFKKKNGYKRSLELSKEYSLYRQDYCGCVYSKQKRDLDNSAKK